MGAFGGYAFGISRTTYNIDIMVDLRDQDFDKLSQRFPLPRYYADPEMMRSSAEMGSMFNIIDTNEGLKADLVPLRREPQYQDAFARRIRCEFIDPTGSSFEAWVAKPTDIIIGKLRAWDEGRSSKHPNDIYSILVFDLSGYSDITVDIETVSSEAAHIGAETLEMWKQLVERAKREVTKRK